ncbi:MAG: hypothetical protein RMK52_03380 [Chitinophagales bacterium]|nr:hypothetical protein [Chitinophagales bacterium]MDW8393268.1 hypothetical protein [Chitinophagales bacterium]
MQPSEQWYCLTTTRDYFEALLMQQRLEAYGITVILINKLDRSQLAHGFVEVQVPLEHARLALEVLESS